MSFIMGIIGIVLDRPRWLAITIVVVTSGLFLLWFGIPFLSMLCS
jgi:hypothetical protein